jgi:predicted small secreted protein
MMKQAMLALAAIGLAGCATTTTGAGADAGDAPEMPPEMAMACDADKVQSFVGQQASEAVGTAIVKQSGARRLRWGPPRSAWSMDYRTDRVNVRYDDAMTIIDITCG